MEMPQKSWLVRTTALRHLPPLDPESVAILRKDYAEMFEREEQQWKVNFDKQIAKARELEESKAKAAKDAKDAQDDTDKYFRSSYDSFETEHD